jgi:hypothetical protein
MDKRTELTARNFPTAQEDASTAAPPSRYGGPESAYCLAFTDNDFLLREELRPVRMQLELLKPEMVQKEAGVESTIVIFGSARILSPEAAAAGLAEAHAAQETVAARHVHTHRGAEIEFNGTTRPIFDTLTRHTSPGSFMGMPMVTVPTGDPKAVPVGLTVMGRPFDDRAVLGVADTVSKILRPTGDRS